MRFVFKAPFESPSKDSGAHIPALSFSKFCFPPICNVAIFFSFLFLVSWDSTVMMILKCLALSKTRAFHCISKAEEEL